MVNLSLINNNNVIKSSEMALNSKLKINSKYGVHRKRKYKFSKRIGIRCRLILSRTE